jgi:16S rRNA (guanine527-N7)-methyltransferase
MSRDALLDEHRALLARWRDTMNLVGPGSLDVHYADARRALRGLDATGAWVDLGTGAGFPGVVLAALFPAATVELVDSRAKRCVFLEEVVERAGATGVTVRCARLESLPDGAYDGVTARALAAPPEVLAYAARLLRPGGRAVLFLQEDTHLPEHPGFEVVGGNAYVVDGKARRSVFLRKA